MTFTSLRPYRLHIVFFIVLMLGLGTLGLFVVTGAQSIDRAMEWVDHTHQVIAKNQNLTTEFERLAGAQQRFVLSGEEKYVTAYGDSKARISNIIAELNTMMQYSTAQISRLNELQHYFLNLSERLDGATQVFRDERAAEMAALAETEGVATPARKPAVEKPKKETVNKDEPPLHTVLPLPPKTKPTIASIDTIRENIERVSGEIMLTEQETLQERTKLLQKQRHYFRLSLLAGCAAIAFVFMIGLAIVGRRKPTDDEEATGSRSGGGVQEMFRLAIEGSSDGIFEWNLAKDTAFYSRQFWGMLGYEPGKFPSTMQSFKDLIHPEDKERVQGHMDRYLSGEIPDYLIIFRMKHKSGRWVWVNARGKALYDESGKPYRLVGAHTDISHIKAYEEKLQKAKESAEKANRAKTDFLAHMSHEIRTPLTAISGIAEIFESHQVNLDDKQRQLVKTLNSSTQSLKELISDILDFSKIESGELEMEEKSFGLQNLFEQVVSIVSVKAQEKGIDFRFDYEDVRKQKCLGDRARLRQVLINLIGNAIKFTDKGEVEVTALRTLQNNNAFLRIDVRDTGIGIDPQNFEMIFERFKQADSSVSRKYGGTGLGLPISLRLARLMGGNIAVESTPGKGSTFTLVIPLKTEEEQEGDESDLRLSHRLSEDIRGQGISQKRILLVEDYEGNIVLLSYLLDGLECHYDVARTGLEALNMWKNNNYDLILMDVQMPEMDGFTATAQIRHMEKEKTLPRTPIIGMTAHALVGDKEKCIEAGMDSYLAKPIVELDLKSKIVEYLSRKKRVA
ncbi:MAG TPA: ATP-binding protein [Alphaproteobacteria bacterium]|nr:ATP-binding protein [Alphaproteobacteria bacterium]